VIDLLKEHLRPAAPLFVATVFGAGILWLWLRPATKGPRRYLAGVLLAYWLLASRVGAGLLVAGLSNGTPRVDSRAAARGADAIVVLSGGAVTPVVAGQVGQLLSYGSLMRALEAARVFKAIGARLVIASGGSPDVERLERPESAMLRDAMAAAGVPSDIILQETSSKTTREQARLVAPMLRGRGVGPFVLVTSATHMRRSLAVFRAEGLDPVPSTAPMHSDSTPLPALLLPNPWSLSVSDDAVYNYGAFAYYWWAGYLRPNDDVRHLR
jgi:uncharacterized SAM-binding protein YcdF (DUF218 family)